MPTLVDGDGFSWDIIADLASAGVGVASGSYGTFDGAMTLLVGNHPFFGTQQMSELDGRQLVFTDTFADYAIEATRRIYVPETSGQGWARFLDTFTNHGADEISVEITIRTNSGNDANFHITSTSSGDTVYDVHDRWVVNDDYAPGGNAAVLHLFGDGSVSPVRTSTSTFPAGGTEGIEYTFLLTLAPGETQSILSFASQQENDTEARGELATIDGLTPAAIAGLTGGQLSTISNWAIAAPENQAPVNSVPGHQSASVGGFILFAEALGNAITVSDPDAGAATISVTLSVMAGTLTIDTIRVHAVDYESFSQTITLVDTIGNINNGLESLAYRPPSSPGEDTLTIKTEDLGATGSGGAKTDIDTIPIGIHDLDRISEAQNDDFQTITGLVLSGNLFADNGYGVDIDAADGMPMIGEFYYYRPVAEGSGTFEEALGTLGNPLVLPSGSTVTVNADGSFTYAQGDAITDDALSFGTAYDQFYYRLVEGSAALVEVEVLRPGTKPATYDPDIFTGLPEMPAAVTYGALEGAVFVNLNTGMGFSNGAEGDTFKYIDTVFGTPDDDYLVGDDHTNFFDGLGGNDVLIGGLGPDVLRGGAGSDTASYEDNQGPVLVNLELGQGFGNAAEGDTFDSIENVRGTAYGDTLIGDGASNILSGGDGDDTLIGGGGADVLEGGAGNDTVSYADHSGSVFIDLLHGRGFNNAAEGDTYAGIENATGGVFDDTLIGDDGDNRLDGGLGADTLVGNGGSDAFVLGHSPFEAGPTGSPNVKTIFDFKSGEDVLEVSAAAFGGGLHEGALPSGAFAVGTEAGDADDRFIYDSAGGMLYFDADGNGSAAQVLIGMFPNLDAIAATDFVIAP